MSSKIKHRYLSVFQFACNSLDANKIISWKHVDKLVAIDK